MKRVFILITITLLLSFEPMMAQTNYTDQITIDNLHISKKSGITSVSFDVNLNDLKISKNDLLIITPVILSNNGTESLALEPFVVKGNLRSKILDRPLEWEGKTHLDVPDTMQLVRKNNTSQLLQYNTTAPFSEWQRQAKLVLKTEIIGCADCREEAPLTTISNKILPDKFIPDFKMSFIVPKIEKVKQRSETYKAHLQYVVGRWDLLPNFENNAAILSEVDAIIDTLKNNNDLTITDFNISGYASPEDTEARNMLLSQRRAETFAAYLEKKHGFTRNSFKIEWFGEDWDGLREAVAASSLANKEEIMQIIDQEPEMDARDQRIIALDNGTTYARLLREFYPPLRRNEYTISFVSRAFDVNEAATIINTKPSLLSLNEMFLVASTYQENSPEYKKVFDIAANTFPESVTANLNAAVAELRDNNPEGALSRLKKVDNADAWNLMGIAYAMQDKWELATSYLKRAADGGNAVAAHNLNQLEQLINDYL